MEDSEKKLETIAQLMELLGLEPKDLEAYWVMRGVTRLTDAELIELKFKEILIKKLGVEDEEIQPSSNIEKDLGADSLDTVEMLAEMEKEFNISISDEDAEKLITVADVIDHFVKEATKKKAA